MHMSKTLPMPHLISQSDFSDLVRDLNLSKNQSELLASILKEWNLLEKETKVCSFRKWQQDFQDFFSRDGDVIFCNDVDSLFKALGLQHKPQDWRLFIDSSNVSLKAVLLHNGNKHPSIPVGYAVRMKETYENLKHMLSSIDVQQAPYTADLQWNRVPNLEPSGPKAETAALQYRVKQAFLAYLRRLESDCRLSWIASRLHHVLLLSVPVGQQGQKKTYYIKTVWPKRQFLIPGVMNVENEPLVAPEKNYLASIAHQIRFDEEFC
ncbi:hypothetical protein AVEN_101176-1 [Araneus ventricosus]|uniref:Uncharacterized protein n=1 Tax=Araneus ventricosus TaxID=182803 RepID=A0A4Y2DEK1_ARAVE|nr:hypothetical protein AVEN_101176-1 [Araneus ventricosus]